jgi:putative peptidoglycan lipid II flippase
LLLRAQIVRVVVGAGKFGWEETIMTADTLALITIGFFALCLNYLLVRAFFALHDTTTPFFAGLISAIINMAAAWFFLSRYGVLALAGAMSFSAVVNFVLLWVPLRVHLGTLEEMKIIRSLAIITIAGLLSGLVTQAMKSVVVKYISLDTFFGVLAQGLIAGGLGLAVYLAVTVALKLPEAITFTSALRRKFIRGYQPKESVSTTVS